MMLRRLTMMPRFFFAEAPQSIEGTSPSPQDISHPPSPTPPRADTLGRSSVPLRKTSACRR